MFYSALHWVDAFLAPDRHPKTRGARQKGLGVDADLSPIHDAFRALEDLSRLARYDCTVFREDVVIRARDEHFVPIREHVRQALSGE